MFGIKNHRFSGMAAMLIAVAFFAFMDGGLKQLAAHYPAAEVASLRGLASFPIVMIWALWAGGITPLIRVRWPLHLIRGVLSVAMLITFSYGVKTLTLSATYAIFFVAPLMITVFSLLFFGERVVRAQWWAIAIGFVGVLVALKPQGAGLVSLGGLAVLACATCYSLSNLLVKVIGKTDSIFAMTFWMTTMLSIGATVIALPGWVTLRSEDYWLIALIAISGSIAQYCITVAFQRAPAASVAPLEYTSLAWGLLLDLTFWGALPGMRTLLGATLAIASGIILLRHESTLAPPIH